MECVCIYIYNTFAFYSRNIYIGESEYDDDEEEEEEFIREGIKNALRAKERLEKAEFLEVCMCIYIMYVPYSIYYRILCRSRKGMKVWKAFLICFLKRKIYLLQRDHDLVRLC